PRTRRFPPVRNTTVTGRPPGNGGWCERPRRIWEADDMDTTPHTVVVGGGVSGLAAAHRLARSGHRVTVLEAASRPGGKLAVEKVAGVARGGGAEAVRARRPEALALIAELGLDYRRPHPRSGPPQRSSP